MRMFLIVRPIWESAVFLLVLGLLSYATFLSLSKPPVILEQGLAHRIFYFHVPVAWVALYGPIVSCLCALFYLGYRKYELDMLSFVFSQLSLLFAIGVIFSGPIWAKSAWGVVWDETDARLQSFVVLFLTLISYFIFRSLLFASPKKKSFSAMLSIFSAVSSILTWGAIRWIDNPGNHPGSVLGKGGMQSEIAESFWFSVFSYHIFFLFLAYVAIKAQIILDHWLEKKENLL